MEGPPDIRVLIVGAGIGGIPYMVIERTSTFRPLGSAISLSAAVQPLLEQLGLLDEINEASKPEQAAYFYDESLTRIGAVDAVFSKERYGYYVRMLSRPTLYNILLRRIPKEKILLGKRVIGVEQTETRAMVRCADQSVHEADVVVGADGAYSAVRQNMFRELDQRHKLRSSDAKPMAIDQECVVGTTEPLDPARFPIVGEEFSTLHIVLSVDRQYAFWAVPVEDNRLSWIIGHKLEDKDYRKQETFKSSEWGPEAAEEICSKVRHLNCPVSGSIDEIINSTKPSLRSRVFLEEKLFKTWTSGRVVLLGDGAMQAMFDAVSIANHLSELEHSTVEAISTCFQAYYDERKKSAKDAVHGSRQVSTILSSHGWAVDVARKVSLSYVPDWLVRLIRDKTSSVRPQAIFLQRVPDRGSVRAKPTRVSVRALEFCRIRRQRAAAAAALLMTQQQLATKQASLNSFV
ncbi:hypothetical protein DFQ26_005365 [Actinomortierella ambigua]|nr:hypothetical protein DFQ26_005365 [Actinomortierella ambigua]